MTRSPVELVEGLTWLDGVWALIVGALLLRGFLRGLVQELLEVVGLALAVYGGLRTSGPLSAWLLQQFPQLPEQAARAGAFAAVAGGIMMVATALTGMMAHLARLSPLSWVDSLGGAAFGGLKGLAVVATLVVLISALPDPGLRALLGDSRISREVRLALPHIWSSLRRVLAVELPALPALEESSQAGPLPLPGRPGRGPARWGDGSVI